MVVELFVVLIVEFAQGGSLVGLERGDGAVEHRSRFLRRAELLGANQCGATY